MQHEDALSCEVWAAPSGRASVLVAWGQSMAGWRERFGVYWASDPVSAEIRGKHLYAVTRLTPVAMAANVLNGVVVCFAFWESAPRASLLIWFALLSAAAARGTFAWWRRRGSGPRAASPRAIHRATLHAALLGLIWAYVPAAWFASADAPHRLLIATLASGMMCAGALVLATVPTASLSYVAILTVASAYALIAGKEPLYGYVALLLCTYVPVIAFGVLSAARVFTARIVSEREAQRQSQMVGLLLRDFEEHATDSLWETDRTGRFTGVSNRLVKLLGEAHGDSPPESLLELVERGRVPGNTDAGSVALQRALALDRPFRDIVLPVQAREGERWWSITARPTTDESGRATGWRGVISDVTGERRAQQRLQQLAHSDPLTGLANRVVLRERLARLVGRGPASRLSGALLFIDLDDFKNINDTFGHFTGDTVLQIAASRLHCVVRERDLLARLGGDEFAIVLSDAGSSEEVAGIAQRLLRELAAPCVAVGHSVTVGASVGIALLPEHGSSVDEALENADLALYAAKASGRGRFEFFSLHLAERSGSRRAV